MVTKSADGTSKTQQGEAAASVDGAGAGAGVANKPTGKRRGPATGAATAIIEGNAKIATRKTGRLPSDEQAAPATAAPAEPGRRTRKTRQAPASAAAAETTKKPRNAGARSRKPAPAPQGAGKSDQAVRKLTKEAAAPEGADATGPRSDDAAVAEPSSAAAKPPARREKAKGKGWSFNPLAPYQRAGEALVLRMRKEKLVTAKEVIREIEQGPQGPQVIAAFDFDGTLLGGLSGAMMMMERMKRKDVKQAEFADNLTSTLKTITKQMEGHELVSRGLAHWAGKSEDEMEDLASHLFENKIQDMIFPEMRDVLAAHRKAGHTIVVATAATRYQVERVVQELGIDNLLCTELEVVDGKLTGKVVGESLFGAGKVEALRKFIEQHGCDFPDTYFYADGDEEIGLMEAVGHPHPVNPSKKLAEAAKKNGWAILRLQSRGGAKAGEVLRGMAGLLAIMPIAPAGLVVGLMSRDKRQAQNLLMPTWIQRQLDMAGVKLRVSGRRNLKVRRPAVFIFNHRNNYDGMFAALLIRNDVAGIGKKEMGQNPIGKLGTLITPTILVERGTGDPEKAAEALKPLIEAVEQGYSIMLAPEGTRVKGHHNSVGPFKKGAFHMAMAAGIPIVPIVIRNALDVASRDGPMRPGTVDVAVLPPIPINDWTKENMADKIEEVRQVFIDTLNNWPEPDEAGD